VLALALTDDVQLRGLEPWQGEVFAAHIEDNRAHLTRWLPWIESIVDVPSATAWLRNYADKQACDTGRLFGIWRGPDLVGVVLLRAFDVKSGSCEIGCWLGKGAEGKGLMTTAARVLMDWAFGVRGMTRVYWQTSPENKRSIAVAERIGMTREGLLRKAFAYNGGHQDTVVLAILAEEWAELGNSRVS
jgi:RimJ/RimL family protein N-acetyltransferase